jgi:hypothetical protein
MPQQNVELNSEQNVVRDIFLSHRSVNKEIVSKLATDIEKFRYQNKALSSWIDEAEISDGQSVTGMVNNGLESSRFIGLVLTPEYFKSESGWTDAEWHAALFRDPDNRNGLILPLLIKNCPYIPILIKHLKLIDLRGKRYEKGLQELVARLRNEKPQKNILNGQIIASSGLIDRSTIIAERSTTESFPDQVADRLYSNLLPIDNLPQYLYSAPINDKLKQQKLNGEFIVPSKRELIQLSRVDQENKGSAHIFTPAFRINEHNIVSFHDLGKPNSPLAAVVDINDVVKIPINEFIVNEDDRKILVSLINMAISRHVSKIGLVIDNTKQGRYFFPPDCGKPRVVTWKPVKKQATRTVAKPCFKDEQLLFWIHLAAYLDTFFLSGKFYIQISPTWVITTNGQKVKSGADIGRILIKWTGMARNLNLLYHMRFWTKTLCGKYLDNTGTILIKAGDHWIKVSSEQATINQKYGIEGDQQNLLALIDSEASVIAEEEDMLIDEGIERGIDKLSIDQEEVVVFSEDVKDETNE